MQAMQPGGAVIRDVNWGDMPSGLPFIFSRDFGLSTTWLTMPVGFETRGSYLYHSGLKAGYNARVDPAYSSLDMVVPNGSHNGFDADRIAACLLHARGKFGVTEAMSNHQKLLLSSNISAAQNAKCLKDLEFSTGLRSSRATEATGINKKSLMEKSANRCMQIFRHGIRG